MTARPRPERPSLRRRLAGTFATLALLIAFAQAALVWIVGNRAEEQLIDQVASEQLELSMAAFDEQPALAQPNTPDMTLHVVDARDRQAEARLPVWLRELPQRPGNFEVFPAAGIEYHVAVGNDSARWFYLVYDVAEHEAREQQIAIVLALSIVAVGAIALLASGQLARRLTADLDRLSEGVADDARLPASPENGSFASLARHAETGRLADALDDYRERLHQALQRERAFSAAAGHELRTPLMRAGSSLDLLRSGKLDAREREIAARVQGSLDEMTMLTGALLRVARGRTGEAAAEVGLAELAAEAIAHLAPEARARGIVVELRVPGEVRRRLDRASLWIVLVNLVRNAIRHSGGGTVTVQWREGALVVDDDGVGIGEEGGCGRSEGAGGDERRSGRRGGSGRCEASRPSRPVTRAAPRDLGLGLAIVQRVCEASGWRLVLGERPGGGTRALAVLDAR